MDNVNQAVRAAAKALELTKSFSCRLMVTARTEAWDGDIEAIDESDAARQVIDMIDTGEIRNGDDGIEGDEILFVISNEADEPSDEIEIDLRVQGQPFSWMACDIVKELATAETDEQRQALIVRAREACSVPEITAGSEVAQ